MRLYLEFFKPSKPENMEATPNLLPFPPNTLHRELSVIEEKSSLELTHEAKKFKKFLEFVKNNHPKINECDNLKILDGIKLKIPPLRNLEDLQSFYQRSFLQSKK